MSAAPAQHHAAAHPLDGPAAERFRVDDPLDIAAWLQSLSDDLAPLALMAADGTAAQATLSSLDVRAGTLVLAFDTAVVPIAGTWTATARINDVRLQFDLHDLMPDVAGPPGTARCAAPTALFRFQRRESFRVRPLTRSGPMARLRHPMIPDMQLALRVLDLSVTGCALLVPDDVPVIEPGVQMNGVQLVLDAQTRLDTGLRLQHVTSIDFDAGGVRLGCEFVAIAPDGRHLLQRYIDKTQRLRNLLAPR